MNKLIEDLYNSIDGNCYLGQDVELSMIHSIGPEKILSEMKLFLDSNPTYKSKIEDCFYSELEILIEEVKHVQSITS